MKSTKKEDVKKADIDAIKGGFNKIVRWGVYGMIGLGVLLVIYTYLGGKIGSDTNEVVNSEPGVETEESESMGVAPTDEATTEPESVEGVKVTIKADSSKSVVYVLNWVAGESPLDLLKRIIQTDSEFSYSVKETVEGASLTVINGVENSQEKAWVTRIGNEYVSLDSYGIQEGDIVLFELKDL